MGRYMNKELENKNDSMVRIIRAMEAAGYEVNAIRPELRSNDEFSPTGAIVVVITPVVKA
jgi:hypothetical protein